MKYIITKYNNLDYNQMIELWKSTDLPVKPYGRDSIESISKGLTADNYEIFVAKLEEKIVGSVVVTDDSRNGWINRLSVLEGHRNSGVASELVKKAESYLKKKRIKVFALLIDNNNDKSIALFNKLGYSEYKNIKYYTKRESDFD